LAVKNYFANERGPAKKHGICKVFGLTIIKAYPQKPYKFPSFLSKDSNQSQIKLNGHGSFLALHSKTKLGENSLKLIYRTHVQLIGKFDTF
jgi:hypothetical protein